MKITDDNYKLNEESDLIPLKDEKNSTKIAIPTEGFKRGYDASEIQYGLAPKKTDKLDEEETMPNFIFNLDDHMTGDLMPAMTEIVDKQQIRAGPAGRAPEVNIPNDRAGLSLDKYNSMPEIPGIK